MSVGGGWRFPSCGECPEAVAVFKVLAVHVGLGGLSVPCPCTEAGAAPAAVFGRSQEQGRRERLSEEVGQREGLCSYCPACSDGCGHQSTGVLWRSMPWRMRRPEGKEECPP